MGRQSHPLLVLSETCLVGGIREGTAAEKPLGGIFTCVSSTGTGAQIVAASCAQSIAGSFQATSCRKIWKEYKSSSAIPPSLSLPSRISWLLRTRSLFKGEDFLEFPRSFLHGMRMDGANGLMDGFVKSILLPRLAARFLIHTRSNLKATSSQRKAWR